MKKRISVLALLLCLLMVFSSCGLGSNKPLKINKDALNTSAVLNTISSTEIADLAGYDHERSNGRFSIFVKETTEGEPAVTTVTYKVLNRITNTVILTKSYNEPRILSEKPFTFTVHNGFIQLQDGKTYTVYKANGTEVGNAKTAPQYINDCIKIGDKVYRYDTKTFDIKASYDYSALRPAIPEAKPNSYNYSDYYIETLYDGSYNVEGFTVYDNEYNFIGTYLVPSNAVDFDFFVLNGGNVIVQYKVALPDDAKDFEIFENSKKYDVVHKLIKAKDLSEKELKLDYYIYEDLYPVGENDEEAKLFKKKIKNIATIKKIEDKRISDDFYWVSINDKGDTKRLYDEAYENLYAIGNGYLIANFKNSENVAILDAKLNVVSEVDAEIFFEGATEKYILTEDAIYDYTFKKLVDLTEKEYDFEGRIANTFIFSDEDGNAYIYEGGTTFTKIADAANGDSFVGIIGDLMYMVATTTTGENPSTTYKFCKADKTVVASFTSMPMPIYNPGTSPDNAVFYDYESKTMSILIEVDGKIYNIKATV